MTLDFNTIYDNHYKRVVNLIKSRINEKHLAEEYANDVFVKIHQHLPKFDEKKCENGLNGWITYIVFNKLTDHYRRKKMDIKSLQDFVDDDGKELYTVTSSTDIEGEYCLKELVDNTHKVIALLPEPYKSITTLFYIKDYSYNEIEDQTGLSISTIKVQLNRARKLMREQLGVV